MSEPAPDDRLRIGDAEREAAISALGVHYTEGRITLTELEERTEQAIHATFTDDLLDLFTDLPAPHPLLPGHPQPAQPVAHPFPYAEPSAPYPPQHPYQPYPPQHAPPAVVSDKSQQTAALLQMLVPIGAGRLYAGHVALAVAQFAVVVGTCGFGAIWPMIDGVLIAVQGGTDGYGRPLRP